MTDDSEYITTRQAAELLQVSVPTAQSLVERGLLKSWKTPGGHRRIWKSSVDEMLRARQEGFAARSKPQSLQMLAVLHVARHASVARQVLDSWDFKVHAMMVATVYEALLYAGETHPDLLVCDLDVAGASGFDMLRGLRSLARFDGVAMVVFTTMTAQALADQGGLPSRIHLLDGPLNMAHVKSLASALWTQRSGHRVTAVDSALPIQT